MRFEFGDVVLLPFPFTNQTTYKQRPAVVINSRQYSLSRPDIIVMAITSQVAQLSRTAPGLSSYGDTLLADWQAAHLLKPSAVKPVVATLEQGLVIKQLGQLSVNDQATLKQTIANLLG